MTIATPIPRHLYRSVAAIAAADVLLLMGYDLIRPTSQSIFLDYFGAAGLPYSWIAIAFATALGVAVVNRLLNRFDVVRLYGVTTAACALLLVALWQVVGFERQTGVGPFVLYVWKDVYIVLLLEQMWSFCNLIFDERQAARLYGFFTAMGSVGAIGGDFIVRSLSETTGSVALIGLGSLLTAAAAAIFMAGTAGVEQRLSGCKVLLPRTDLGGLTLLAKSPYLLGIAGLVFVMQIVITLLDYHFNGELARSIPQTDTRSAYLGTFYFAVNGTALAVQLVVVPLALSRLGALRSLLVSPLTIIGGLLAFIFAPGLASAGIVLVVAKGLDYSLTRAAKEMLYVPLAFEEKYKAKAVIDMFVYRAAKALSSGSLVLFALVPAMGAGIVPLIALFMPVWLGVLVLIGKRRRGLP